jgi:hypothetical protein
MKGGLIITCHNEIHDELCNIEYATNPIFI